MIDPRFAVDRNLNDAGCDETTKKTFLDLCSQGKLMFMKARRKLTPSTFFFSKCGMMPTDKAHSSQRYPLTLFSKTKPSFEG